jgi:hypothetical protein
MTAFPAMGPFVDRIHKNGVDLLWAGLFLELLGVLFDSHWHTTYGAGESGIPLPHWLTLLGMAVALVGVTSAQRSATGWRRVAFAAGALAALAQLVGATWDNLLHSVGREPAAWAAPHALSRLGLLALIAVVIVVILVEELQGSGE